jgi:hypothetical protein
MSEEKPKNTPDLMHALSFNDADLKANQEGYLSETQRRRLKWRRLAMTLVFVFFLMVGVGWYLGALAVFLPPDRATFTNLLHALAILILVGPVYTVFLWILRPDWKVYAHILATGQIDQVTGKVTHVSHLVRTGTHFNIGEHDYRFNLRTPLFKQVIDVEKAYHFYYIPQLRIVLSAELASDE